MRGIARSAMAPVAQHAKNAPALEVIAPRSMTSPFRAPTACATGGSADPRSNDELSGASQSRRAARDPPHPAGFARHLLPQGEKGRAAIEMGEHDSHGALGRLERSPSELNRGRDSRIGFDLLEDCRRAKEGGGDGAF